jgi:signal transduction histidine kinase
MKRELVWETLDDPEQVVRWWWTRGFHDPPGKKRGSMVAHGAADSREMERVLVNLLLNACEVADPNSTVMLRESHGVVEIRVMARGREFRSRFANGCSSRL